MAFGCSSLISSLTLPLSCPVPCHGTRGTGPQFKVLQFELKIHQMETRFLNEKPEEEEKEEDGRTWEGFRHPCYGLVVCVCVDWIVRRNPTQGFSLVPIRIRTHGKETVALPPLPLSSSSRLATRHHHPACCFLPFSGSAQLRHASESVGIEWTWFWIHVESQILFNAEQF